MSLSIVIKVKIAKEVHKRPKLGGMVREGLREKEVVEDRLVLKQAGSQWIETVRNGGLLQTVWLPCEVFKRVVKG